MKGTFVIPLCLGIIATHMLFPEMNIWFKTIVGIVFAILDTILYQSDEKK